MCNYQTLYHDDSTGYVVKCLECDKFQVGYGNIMLTLNREGYDAFHWWLKKVRDEQQPDQKQTLRCIPIPTPCDGVKILLSMRELLEFEQMLDEADTQLCTDELMKLF